MPQDTTIYWDGNYPAPAPVQALPAAQQIALMQLVRERKDELNRFNYMPVLISLVVFIIFFSAMAVYSNKKTKQKNQSTMRERKFPLIV